MPFRLGKNPLWPLLASVLLVNLACRGQTLKPITHDPVHVELSFSCLWWSEDQQENLKLSSPPPKTTEVKITKWQFSDPVSTPHPEHVDLVIALSNKEAEALTGLDVEVSGEWKVGLFHHQPKDAVWTRPSVLKQFHDVSLAKSGMQTLRVGIDLKSKMDGLDKTHQWPYALRTTVSVRRSGAPELLSKASTTLPIISGD
jgi:hypothetical protein